MDVPTTPDEANSPQDEQVEISFRIDPRMEEMADKARLELQLERDSPTGFCIESVRAKGNEVVSTVSGMKESRKLERAYGRFPDIEPPLNEMWNDKAWMSDDPNRFHSRGEMHISHASSLKAIKKELSCSREVGGRLCVIRNLHDLCKEGDIMTDPYYETERESCIRTWENCYQSILSRKHRFLTFIDVRFNETKRSQMDLFNSFPGVGREFNDAYMKFKETNFYEWARERRGEDFFDSLEEVLSETDF